MTSRNFAPYACASSPAGRTLHDMQPERLKHLIGSAKAAEMFGVDRATFNRWVQMGRVPVALKLDGQTGARLFDAGVIEAMAGARTDGAA